jgi:hypothetical protein
MEDGPKLIPKRWTPADYTVADPGSGGIPDAPSTGTLYGRLNGQWSPVAGPGVADAPSDGSTYGRKNGGWLAVTPGISDAPSDGNVYSRQNGAWAAVSPKLSILATKSTSGTSTSGTILGPIFTAGDSYIDDAGNGAFLSTGIPTEYDNSNGPSFGMIVPIAFGQPQGYIGRYTPGGSSPSPLGNNYAVSGAQIIQNTAISGYGLNTQIAKLLADYPGGLPGNSCPLISKSMRPDHHISGQLFPTPGG